MREDSIRVAKTRAGVRRLALTVGLALVSGLTACSSSPKNLHRPRHLIVNTLRFRRPHSVRDDEFIPQNADEKGAEHFSCETPLGFFDSLPLPAIRACVNSINRKLKVTYRLRRGDIPFLELQAESNTPECLLRFLPVIPVPREIAFESRVGTGSDAKGGRECYTARIDTRADEFLGIRLPVQKIDLPIRFPLLRNYRDAADLTRQMAGWVLTLFYDGANESFAAKILPSFHCDRCLGERPLTDRGEVPQIWPAQAPEVGPRAGEGASHSESESNLSL